MARPPAFMTSKKGALRKIISDAANAGELSKQPPGIDIVLTGPLHSTRMIATNALCVALADVRSIKDFSSLAEVHADLKAEMASLNCASGVIVYPATALFVFPRDVLAKKLVEDNIVLHRSRDVDQLEGAKDFIRMYWNCRRANRGQDLIP